ncbi:MAG: hypothetical protein AAGF92_04135 [Myxococcota bacterium]
MSRCSARVRPLLLSVVLIALTGSAGCSDDSTGQSTGGSGGDGGTAGAGGSTGGASGEGGDGGEVPLTAFQLACRDWCDTSPAGPQCWLGDGGSECLDFCESEEDGRCAPEFLVVLECDIENGCQDLLACDAENAAAELCFISPAPELTCDLVSEFCEVEFDGCVDAFESASTPCVRDWARYARCVENGDSCANCASEIENGTPGCTFPEGADQDDFGGEPPMCLEIAPDLFGCADRCPSGDDSECNALTFCSNGRCDAECINDTQCEPGDECERGRCALAPPTCGEGNATDPLLPNADAVLACEILGGVPVSVTMTLAANVQAPLASGSTAVPVQVAFSIPSSTVNTLITLAGEVDTLTFEATVAGPVEERVVALAPVPCALPLVEDEALQVATALIEEPFSVSQPGPFELTLRDVTLVVDGSGTRLSLSSEGPSCEWDNGQRATLALDVANAD